MPELPEVETTRLGLKPHIIKQSVVQVTIRHHQLRWPIPKNLEKQLKGQKLKALERRGKYLLFKFENGTLIIHLGMSGSLRVLSESTPAKKHDHVDIYFSNKKYVRFTDPRRFGAILWTSAAPEAHVLLIDLGANTCVAK